LIIIDASAVVEMALTTRVGKLISAQIIHQDTALIAPEMLSLEVIQALRKQRNLKLISEEKASGAFALFCLMPIQYENHEDLLQRVWQLRMNMSSYDASYVALAEKLNVQIWTCDRKYENTPLHKAKTQYFDPAP
jgi:predicted nucleic acid-binding protein